MATVIYPAAFSHSHSARTSFGALSAMQGAVADSAHTLHELEHEMIEIDQTSEAMQRDADEMEVLSRQIGTQMSTLLSETSRILRRLRHLD